MRITKNRFSVCGERWGPLRRPTCRGAAAGRLHVGVIATPVVLGVVLMAVAVLLITIWRRKDNWLEGG
jgi:hypothetical protein